MLNEKKEFYYVNVGLLIYLLGSTILFLVGNLTAILSPKMSLFTWILNALLIIINQFFILIEWKKSFYKKEINTAL
jgi:positive regulator of sigma E activity